MTTPTPATTLIRAAYDIQRAALQPAYDRATRALEAAYRAASKQWAGALAAVRELAADASREELRSSVPFALFRADLHTGLRDFSEAAQQIGVQMEQDGIEQGQVIAYRTISLTDRPARVDVSDVRRITIKPQYPLRFAEMQREWEQRIEVTFAAAENGYSAAWIVERLTAYYQQQKPPVVDMLTLVRTIQTIMAQRTIHLVYRRMG